MPLSSLDLIPSFHAVMRTGSLSAAARDLRLSQPTVRRHIEALEAELDATLFTRAANGLTPTPLAQDLLGAAQAVLDEAHGLVRAASAGSDAITGTVRVTTSRVIAAHVLPLALASFQKTAPDLTIEVAATDQTEDLLRRAADIAIRLAPPRGQALRALKLRPVQFGLFAAPSLLAKTRAPASLSDLAQASMVLDDRDGMIAPALAAAGAPPLGRVRFRSDDPLAQIGAIASGLGFGLCQSGIARRLGLVRVLAPLEHLMPIWLVMHEDQARVRRIRAVFDHLKTALPDVY